MNSAPLSLWRGDTLVTVMPARRPHGALSVSPGETAIAMPAQTPEIAAWM